MKGLRQFSFISYDFLQGSLRVCEKESIFPHLSNFFYYVINLGKTSYFETFYSSLQSWQHGWIWQNIYKTGRSEIERRPFLEEDL